MDWTSTSWLSTNHNTISPDSTAFTRLISSSSAISVEIDVASDLRYRIVLIFAFLQYVYTCDGANLTFDWVFLEHPLLLEDALSCHHHHLLSSSLKSSLNQLGLKFDRIFFGEKNGFFVYRRRRSKIRIMGLLLLIAVVIILSREREREINVCMYIYKSHYIYL